jgi:uncharacterized protein (DUF1810 family)
MDDPYNLQRFIDAQGPVFARVRSELLDGQKRGHWVWFVFPQLVGLGKSEMAIKFSISSRAEAKAYLEHPILGAKATRLHEIGDRGAETFRRRDFRLSR